MRSITGRLSLLLLAAPTLAVAAAAAPGTGLPLSAPVPGGVAVVCVGRASEPEPRVVFGGERVLVTRVGDTWRAVVGLPLGLKPGAHELEIDDGDGGRSLRFDVRAHKYGEQHVRLRDRRMVEPPKAVLARKAREHEIQLKAL